MKLREYLNAERGSSARLAAQLEVSPSYLSQMAAGDAAISPARCVLIEQYTDGAVTRRDLRPKDWMDIWPEIRPARKQQCSRAS
jgi:DNA-binding transcriptional regulator YdaS (Cro superfamily)